MGPGLRVSEGLKDVDIEHRGRGDVLRDLGEGPAPEEPNAPGTTLVRFSS